MSSNSEAIVVQCAGCGSKLRMKASARGKTIACPKCGQQMKIRDGATRTSSELAAMPAKTSSTEAGQPTGKLVPAKPVIAKPVVAKPMVAAAAAQNNWDDLQIPPAVGSYQPQQPVPSYYTAPRAKPGNRALIWVGGAAAASLLVLGVIVAFLFAMSSSGEPVAANSTRPAAVPAAVDNSKPPGSAASLPSNAANKGKPLRFPDLGMGITFGDKATLHRILIPREGRRPMEMNVFIPKGEHGDQSLPVVFEAPAGTNLLHGADVGFARPDTEYLPFTEAGMITVSFSLDGPMSPTLTPEAGAIFVQQLSSAYKQFVESDAGVDCGSMAIDFVLQKVPGADPKRLFVWGHSSAATLSLLLASKDTRISKCIAIAPITDLNLRLGEMLTERSMQQFFPNLGEYFKSGSPITYVEQLKCPVFLAHARDDDNEPFPNSQKYVEALQRAGGNITFEARASGGHYQELIEASIPKAIEWLKK